MSGLAGRRWGEARRCHRDIKPLARNHAPVAPLGGLGLLSALPLRLAWRPSDGAHTKNNKRGHTQNIHPTQTTTNTNTNILRSLCFFFFCTSDCCVCVCVCFWLSFRVVVAFLCCYLVCFLLKNCSLLLRVVCCVSHVAPLLRLYCRSIPSYSRFGCRDCPASRWQSSLRPRRLFVLMTPGKGVARRPRTWSILW